VIFAFSQLAGAVFALSQLADAVAAAVKGRAHGCFLMP
jgi:hypothetical protein